MRSPDGYRHHFVDRREYFLPPGKVVCVGRNYAAHIRELNNETPAEPVLFIKPATALVALELPLSLRFQPCHFETELAVLIGKSLSRCTPEQAQLAITGLGVGLDLTLRELQDDLKSRGLPWEKAKAFDGSCALSHFVPYSGQDLQNIDVRLTRNGSVVQSGNSVQMLFPVLDLLCYISTFFTLLPGDVVLTGTPEGVGVLEEGDSLKAELDGLVSAETQVAYL